jgi:23S rRNA (uracil1939-C5)-methyltransferase
MSGTVRLTITQMGARGDGIAHGDGGPVYVPYTLPGDIVTAIVEGQGAAR